MRLHKQRTKEQRESAHLLIYSFFLTESSLGFGLDVEFKLELGLMLRLKFG